MAVEAPNVIVIERNLVTSGQPSATALAGLKAEGFEAVIHLAPSSVSDAVKDEPMLLAKQGIEFVHVSIPFGEPTEAHFEAVSAELARLKCCRRPKIDCQDSIGPNKVPIYYPHRLLTAHWEREKCP
jgi:hypothetical protein